MNLAIRIDATRTQPLPLEAVSIRFGDDALNPQSPILIVDQSCESSEILRALLERQGRFALSIRRPDEAIEAAEETHPALIVLNVDSEVCSQTSNFAELGASANRINTPIVVIGSAKKLKAQVPHGEFIAKPYQYRDLLRKIDQVIGDAA